MNAGRSNMAGCGTSTSALAAGGQPGVLDNVESFNGSTWTAATALNTARVGGSGAASVNTAALVWGGYTQSPPTVITTNAESWDGSSWTEGPNLNTATYGGAGAGTQPAAIAFGGSAAPGKTGATETYDGSSWTTSPATLGTARGLAGAGTQTAALGCGGPVPGGSVLTEEFSLAVTTRSVDTS